MAWKRRCRPGDHLVICDRTGFVTPASKVRREWTGALVMSNKWEAEHPQDKLPAFRDDQSVRESRPDRTPIFVGALVTEVATSANAGATTVVVASTGRMEGGDHIGIALDSKDIFRAIIQTVDSSTQLTITARLPGSVSAGNIVTDYSAVAEQGVS